MSRCRRCGRDLADRTQQFCIWCGQPVVRQRELDWRLVAAAGVVLLLIGVTAFLLLRGGESGTPVAQSPVVAEITVSTTEPATRTTTTTTTPPTTTSSTVSNDPGQVVQRYYDAINKRDYRAAWNLGGSNLGKSYEQFAAGFDGTDQDSVTITAVSGETVYLHLTARQRNGTVLYFQGSYVVRAGIIASATLKAATN
ncbi:hypothetical protein GCM10010174_23690 [Kutzneria viridogrisea]|uniref:Zinc ribbon domain-containing protein n=1 Tax=Kutzneria viridogrisea TaxID=47990 RepID=A0ABR6BWJ1_9PSEU|nr:hypothetical protein [Kutzneria viridogrisea]